MDRAKMLAANPALLPFETLDNSEAGLTIPPIREPASGLSLKNAMVRI